jgi:HSP20 family molecular chaperone IbpA
MRDSEKWVAEELQRVYSEMHRMIRQFVPREQWNDILQHRGWRPPTDVYDTDRAAVVKVEVSGVDRGDIQISFANRILTVTGMRRDPAEKLTYQQMEIKYGVFRTDVFLPWPVKEKDIEANYEDGFLTIVLPKAKGTHKVPITVVEENK